MRRLIVVTVVGACIACAHIDPKCVVAPAACREARKSEEARLARVDAGPEGE